MSILSSFGGGSKADNPGRAAEFAVSDGLFSGAGLRAQKGQDRLKLGLTGGLKSIQDAQIAEALAMVGIVPKNATIAGNLATDFLGGLEADPLRVAENQYNLLAPILQQQQQDDFLDLESRLFGQGRLGSTGGARDLNALFDSQQDADRALLFDSLNQGLASQQQNANIGMALAQMEPQLTGLFRGLGSASLTDALNIQDSALNNYSILAAAQGAGSGASAPGRGGVGFGDLLLGGLASAGLSAGTNALFGPTASTVLSGRPMFSPYQLVGGRSMR